MTPESLYAQRASAIARDVRSGERSAVSVVDQALARIDAVDTAVGAYLEVFREDALSRAANLDARRESGESLGALAGVPVALKDNLSFEGHQLTCGSKILGEYTAKYTATAVEQLLAADAIPIGRVNLDEFAMGSSCENSALAVTRNPWNLDMVPGGSSGGSAAAVAASTVPLALGSDTGGSIRQPAAFCGVVGVKPTWGRVSRYGLVAFASSLDQIGPLTRSVEDAALAYEVIAGHDPRDSTSLEHEVKSARTELGEGIEGLRVGLVEQVDAAGLKSDVFENWQSTLGQLEALGARVQPVSLPNLEASIAAYYVLANCEASANLSRFDGVRYGYRDSTAQNLNEVYFRSRSAGFGPEVKRRIMLGTFALTSGYYDAYYGRARGVVRALALQMGRAFESVDVLVTPSAPSGAFGLGEKADDPLAMYLSDVFTTPASLTGIPAISVPTGFDARGLPLSLQIMAPHLEEVRAFRVAAAVEGALALDREPPALTNGVHASAAQGSGS